MSVHLDFANEQEEMNGKQELSFATALKILKVTYIYPKDDKKKLSQFYIASIAMRFWQLIFYLGVCVHYWIIRKGKNIEVKVIKCFYISVSG